MLTIYNDVIIGSGTFRDGDTSNNSLITIDSGPKFRSWTFDPAGEVYVGGVTCLTNPVGVSFIDSASAVIVSSTASQVDFIEISGGYRSNITSSAVAASTVGLGKGQQVAGDPATKVAFSVSNNVTGKVMKIDGNDFTVSTSTLGTITGKVTTVLAHPASSSWFLGTDDGKVHEIDSTPTVTSTITLPTTPNTGTAPTWKVSGLSFHNGVLLVLTAQGMMFFYNYPAGTEIKRMYVGGLSSGGNALLGAPLCDSASGTTLYCPNHNKTTNNSFIMEIDLIAKATEDMFTNEINTKSCVATGIDPINYYAWAMVDTNRIRIFKLNDKSTTTVAALIHDPPGTPIAGRVTRIKIPKTGLASVESDQNISAVETNINAQKETEYLDLITASGKFDIRHFST